MRIIVFTAIALALSACSKPEAVVAPVASSAPAVAVVPQVVASTAPAANTEPSSRQPAKPVQTAAETVAAAKPEPVSPPAKKLDQCEKIATSKEGRNAVMKFAENELKEIIARKAMETFPVPARLEIVGLISSGDVKVAENYELVYTPVAAELVNEADKGIVCRISTSFHADGTITYTGEGNDGTTKVKEAPAKIDAKRDLFLKTTQRIDGGVQMEVFAL